MDIVNFDALKAQDRIITPSDVDPNEDYFIIGKHTNHYTTNSMLATKYPVYAIKAGDVMGGYKPPYKIYTALLTQTGVDAPTAIVLENTLGNIVWTRNPNTAGNYEGTLAGAFVLEKTGCILGNKGWTLSGNSIDPYDVTLNTFGSTNVVYLSVNNSLGSQDGKLDNVYIEIKVYN